ncbi:photosystem reaction center subunit H [Methylobacterium sp. NEAU 140]|uniref:photosystem reaction center subunit H n=1 Tax=Methylobacterium sp. NEAU 140 TaxID=3064945 RepID=UPI0027354992|nr:photosystem reaction center subunit H [Methylobacterium sp. NEAU 140]MDP4023059.1 photosystem reaction center subunit H [Methylobacterium sp. NEAU 140]
MRRPTIALCLTLLAVPAHAACDVKGARIEETIAAKPDLQKDANAQTVRDLRTLRDAAIVLDTYKYPGECEVLLGIARTMLADPGRTIEQGGDTDEEKADDVAEARKPKLPSDGKPAPKAN